MTTREEQIYKAADKATYQTPPQYSELVHKSRKVMCAYETGFIDGCVWADSHPNWISVEDELPTIPEKWYCVEVLFRTKDSTNYLGKYFGDKWISYEDHTFRTEDISYWMKIQPPRKED